MKNMRLPIRPAPVEELRPKQNHQQHYKIQPKAQQQRKKPPPRPPPPNFDKIISSSVWNLPSMSRSDKEQPRCLIEWSPPISPNSCTKRAFAPFIPNNGAGSISSSFSSSTSSLASCKKSFEYDTAFNISPWSNTQKQGPTIIRPHSMKKPKARNESPVTSLSSRSLSLVPILPPNLPPPPSPQGLTADDEGEIAPFAIALYDYRTGHADDLTFETTTKSSTAEEESTTATSSEVSYVWSFCVNDIVYLTERINDEWYRGHLDVQEGMFPATFVDVQVPLPQQKQQSKFSTVLYTYTPDMDGYLNLCAGNKISVLYRVDADWYMGELNGKKGQFPINYVDKLPDGL